MVLFQRRLIEGFDGLFPQGAAIDQKKNTAKALGLQQAVHQANDSARFSGSGRHGQQTVAAIGG
ncbi:hypothetical protein D3C77_670010 [compost metagenome]